MGILNKIENASYELIAPEKKELLENNEKLDNKISNDSLMQSSIDKLQIKIDESRTGKERYILNNQLDELREIYELYTKTLKTKITDSTKKEIENIIKTIKGQIGYENHMKNEKINKSDLSIKDEKEKIKLIIENEKEKLNDTTVFTSDTIRDMIETNVDIIGIKESLIVEKYQDFFDDLSIIYINYFENNLGKKLNESEINILTKNDGLQLDEKFIDDFRNYLLKNIDKKYLKLNVNIKFSKGLYEDTINFNLKNEYKKILKESNKKIENKKEQIKKRKNKEENLDSDFLYSEDKIQEKEKSKKVENTNSKKSKETKQEIKKSDNIEKNRKTSKKQKIENKENIEGKVIKSGIISDKGKSLYEIITGENIVYRKEKISWKSGKKYIDGVVPDGTKYKIIKIDKKIKIILEAKAKVIKPKKEVIDLDNDIIEKKPLQTMKHLGKLVKGGDTFGKICRDNGIDYKKAHIIWLTDNKGEEINFKSIPANTDLYFTNRGSKKYIYLKKNNNKTSDTLYEPGFENFKYLVVKVAKYFPNIPASKLKVLIDKENQFWNPYTKTPDGSAYGLGQMIKSTWNTHGKGLDRFNPEDQLMATCRFLDTIMQKHSCSIELALALYNTGENINKISNETAKRYARKNPAISILIKGEISKESYIVAAIAYYNEIDYKTAESYVPKNYL